MSARVSVPHDRRQYTQEGTVLSLVRLILNASGPLGLMAVGLTIFLGWSVWQRLDQIEANQHLILETMRAANVAMSTFVARDNELDRQRAELMAQQVRLLRQVCIHTAERDTQAKLCTE